MRVGAPRWAALLVAFSLFASARAVDWPQGCKQYPAAGLGTPGASPVLSSISVGDGFDIATVSVDNLALTAPKIAPLKITLTASEPNATPTDILKGTVVLKDVHQGGDATGIAGVTFEDTSMTPFPDAGSAGQPITGTFFPNQDLQTLALGSSVLAFAGGSQGTWTLRIVDLSTNGTDTPIDLQSWTLVLCPASAADNSTASPAAAGTQTSAAAQSASAAGALTSNAEVAAAASNPTISLLGNLLDRVNRVAPDHTILTPLANSSLTLRSRLFTPTAADDTTSTASTPASATPAATNQTILDHIRMRLDELLGTNDTSSADSSTPPAANSTGMPVTDGSSGVFGTVSGDNTSAFGQYMLGPMALPEAATQGFLTALRNLVDDVTNSSNATSPADSTTNSSLLVRSADGGALAGAPSVVAQWGPSDGSSPLAAFTTLLTGSTYLDTIAQIASGLQDAIMSLPFVQKAQSAAGKATTAVQSQVSAAATRLQSTGNFASQQIQSRAAFMQGHVNMIEAAIKGRISNYDQALTSTSSLLSQAITKHSNEMLAQAQQLKTQVQDLRSQVSTQTSQTAKTVLGHLDTMLKSTNGIGSTAQTLQTDMQQIINQLIATYKTQLQSALDVWGAGANSVHSAAQFQAESAIDQLNGALTKINSAFDALAKGSGPLVGKSLTTYQQGLQFMETALQGIKTRIAAPPAIDFSALAASPPGSGALLQQLQESMGIGSRSSKVLSLLGNIDGLSSRITSLFPSSAPSAASG